ncbi:hypothetical protein RhiirC2_795369 [Rhizophagus irregularis]|uniref:Uncharacterized protein n=1 Tax=Rhizophagus irregularis TaxID=588596 RepID=A0A2N1MBP3_9GLOM|nr:hypothetical protein RhiirC2_795369 [Rhizophagus irregularis]
MEMIGYWHDDAPKETIPTSYGAFFYDHWMLSYYMKCNIFRFRQFRHVETISAFQQIREPMSKCQNSFDNFDMPKLPNFGRQLYMELIITGSSLSDNDILELDAEELIKQVDFIQNTQSSSLLALENNNDIQYILSNEQLNFVQMIEIRTKHKAYSSKILEYIYCGKQIARNNDPNTINPNKASHIIVYTLIKYKHLLLNKYKILILIKYCYSINIRFQLVQHRDEQPDNIIYHLVNTDVIVTENSLNLKGFGKNVYNYFNREDIKETIV